VSGQRRTVVKAGQNLKRRRGYSLRSLELTVEYRNTIPGVAIDW